MKIKSGILKFLCIVFFCALAVLLNYHRKKISDEKYLKDTIITLDETFFYYIRSYVVADYLAKTNSEAYYIFIDSFELSPHNNPIHYSNTIVQAFVNGVGNCRILAILPGNMQKYIIEMLDDIDESEKVVLVFYRLYDIDYATINQLIDKHKNISIVIIDNDLPADFMPQNIKEFIIAETKSTIESPEFHKSAQYKLLSRNPLKNRKTIIKNFNRLYRINGKTAELD